MLIRWWSCTRVGVGVRIRSGRIAGRTWSDRKDADRRKSRMWMSVGVRLGVFSTSYLERPRYERWIGNLLITSIRRIRKGPFRSSVIGPSRGWGRSSSRYTKYKSCWMLCLSWSRCFVSRDSGSWDGGRIEPLSLSWSRICVRGSRRGRRRPRG